MPFEASANAKITRGIMCKTAKLPPSSFVLPDLHPRPATVWSARFGTYCLFFVDGLGFGIWAGHIPVFKQKFELNDAQLGVALFALVFGSIVSMPIVGRLISRFGSRSACIVSGLGYGVIIPLLALAPWFPTFAALAFVFGACKGGFDVSINAQAHHVESATGRSIMASFQALWSVGGLMGAGLASVALRHGFGAPFSLGLVGPIVMTVVLFFGRKLMKEPIVQPKHSNGFWFRNHRVLRIGILTFLALFSEGAIADWGAVYLKNTLGVSAAAAAVGYVGFSLAMAIGRFLGDRFVNRLGILFVLRVCGALTASGVTFSVVVQNFPAAVVGFIIAGFGVANLVPILFGAAGRDSEAGSGPALATVTSLGYFGFLIGPPLIGLLAEGIGLRAALALIVVFGLTITSLAKIALS
jgi:MFS family permease